MWTVDVESDWGGRDNSIRGIELGVPKILDAFDKYHFKAIFFLSTKKLVFYLPLAREIIRRGHTIGSHGHEHFNWKKANLIAWWSDFTTSKQLLKEYLDVDVDYSLYRAPWFSRINTGFVYDNPKNHVSVLKHTWFGGSIPKNPIFYIHPFDIVKAPKKAPNLFCKILYSNPEKVMETFERCLKSYS